GRRSSMERSSSIEPWLQEVDGKDERRFRNSDFGFRIYSPNPNSEIRIPKSPQTSVFETHPADAYPESPASPHFPHRQPRRSAPASVPASPVPATTARTIRSARPEVLPESLRPLFVLPASLVDALPDRELVVCSII